MSEEQNKTAIRKRSGLTPALTLGVGGCLLGTVIVTGGYLIANQQQAVLQEQSLKAGQERDLLLGALEDAHLNGPRLRLEELASLPLVPEFVALAESEPDSVDAKELGDYLKTVLEASVAETGLDRIVLEGGSGDELLVAVAPSAQSGAAESHELESQVVDYHDPEKTSGRLAGYLAKSGVNVLLPASSGGAEVTASVPQASSGATAAVLTSVPETTKLFALAAGIAVAVASLLGAALVRRRDSGSDA
ncbi:hypothetical protein [Roseibium sp. MMSF_3544]|uniref:hypothetical protein n=1 Tax=unclassified Roseibium TaxID=2629323 RepID=UPI00273F3843|nr:hypothetical protein [Roseibium sp. MMSF_3544]